MVRASLAIMGTAVVLAGALEPAWEFFVGDAPFDWAFGPTRNTALATFVGTGLLTYVVTLNSFRRRREQAVVVD